MTILLVMPDVNFGGRYHIAPGIMYLSAYLKRQGFSVDTLNLNHYPPNKLSEVLAQKPYDLVATGGLFTYFAQFRHIIRTARRVSPRSRLILGGPIASADPEFALEALGPDFLVLGEGELPAAGLLRALSDGRTAEEVPGLAFRRAGRFFQTRPSETIPDLDSLPWPDYEGFEFDRFLDRSAFAFDQSTVSPHPVRLVAPIISGRGCSARCTFCYRLMPSYRLRSIPEVIREIRHLKDRYAINEVLIWDDLFSSTPERLESFCREVRPLGLVWGCQLRVPVVNGPVLRLMKESGCTLISYGLESASPAVLRSMRKGIDVPRMEEALRLTKEAGLTIQGNFIFGDPAETPQTVEETLRFYRRHRQDFSNSIALGAIAPYPGTALYQDLKARGRMRNLQRFYETSFDEHGRAFNMTAMPDAWFRRLIERELPAEEKAGRVFGRVLDSRPKGQGRHSISYLCPFCGRRSEGLLMAVSAAYPIMSFRVACRCCGQRSYVPKLGLLGWRRAAQFALRAWLAGLWQRLKATDLYAALRYHPSVDELWNRYKERTSERTAIEGATAFQEMTSLAAVRARLGFIRHLLGAICGAFLRRQ